MAIDGINRAPYACDPAGSRGRLHAEPPSQSRSPFRRDCDRIIHATAFRRLKHKTQVFVFTEGDHYRTRLTHTLEVTQISRALDACLAAYGGFDHNAQTLRVVTALERRYPGFDGLNLTWETLEGLVKHNGPLTDRGGMPLGPYRERGVPETIRDYSQQQDLQLWSFASLEAQLAAVADDIAYDAHDIDDGMRAALFDLDDIAAVALPGRIVGDISTAYPRLDVARQVHELVRRLIGLLIEDVLTETRRKLATLKPQTADDVRRAQAAVAGFSAGVAEADRAIKDFLKVRMYREARVMRVMDQAAGVVRDLFACYSAQPGDLPDEWRDGLDRLDEAGRARRIADFIAGMTDRFALAEHQRLFDFTPELR